MNEIQIKDFSALMSFHEALPKDKFFCFRGQSDAAWDLIPSIYRGLQDFPPPPDENDDGHWLGELERDVYREFERIGRRYAPENWDFGDPWHRLVLAQHFGVPTRLVDWTKSVFVAAYFAATSNPDRDAAIWCLNVEEFPFPSQLGRRISDGGYRIAALNSCTERDRLCFLVDVSSPVPALGIPGGMVPPANPRPSAIPSKQSGHPGREGFLVILEPPVLEDRIRSQKSLFSVYVSYDDNELEWDHRRYIERVERENSKELLTKLVIPKHGKNQLAFTLQKNLVNVDDIYPDLPGLVMRLQNRRQQDFDYYTNERANW